MKPLKPLNALGVHLVLAEFIQRSLLMSYPESITIRFNPISDNRSTLAIYSRSHFGKSDFGVNKERTTEWLAALDILQIIIIDIGSDLHPLDELKM